MGIAHLFRKVMLVNNANSNPICVLKDSWRDLERLKIKGYETI